MTSFSKINTREKSRARESISRHHVSRLELWSASLVSFMNWKPRLFRWTFWRTDPSLRCTVIRFRRVTVCHRKIQRIRFSGMSVFVSAIRVVLDMSGMIRGSFVQLRSRGVSSANQRSGITVHEHVTSVVRFAPITGEWVGRNAIGKVSNGFFRSRAREICILALQQFQQATHRSKVPLENRHELAQYFGNKHPISPMYHMCYSTMTHHQLTCHPPNPREALPGGMMSHCCWCDVITKAADDWPVWPNFRFNKLPDSTKAEVVCVRMEKNQMPETDRGGEVNATLG